MIEFKIYQVPLGLPVTETRAQELATTIISGIDEIAFDALVELLLGIAPSYTRMQDFPDSDLRNFTNDLECRRLAAKYALMTFFQYSDEFKEAFERYTHKHGPKHTAKELEELFEFDSSPARALANVQPAPTKASKQGRGKR